MPLKRPEFDQIPPQMLGAPHPGPQPPFQPLGPPPQFFHPPPPGYPVLGSAMPPAPVSAPPIPFLPPDLSGFENVESLLDQPEFNFLSREAKAEVVRLAKQQRLSGQEQQINRPSQAQPSVHPSRAAHFKQVEAKVRESPNFTPPAPPKEFQRQQIDDDVEEGEIR